MPTPMTIEMENEMRTLSEINRAQIFVDQIALQMGLERGVYMQEHINKCFDTIRAALQSPRVPDAMFKKLGSLIKAVDGGTFENDPHDAIIDAAIRTLSSPRVPVIEGLDEAIAVINKFIRARDAEIDFLPEKSTKNTSEWISHFMHNVNYTLSFNDWMSLDKVHAYAELSKTQEPSLAPPQKGV